MARHIVRPLMLTALVALGASVVVGCTAEARIGSPPPAAPPPPAPPPPAVTAEPVATAEPAPAPEPPKEKIAVKDGRIGIPGNIVYETGKAIIKPESEPTLSALKDFMDQNKNFTRIRIEGHTDNVGKAADNMKLSAARAMAVVDWLATHDVPKERCLAVGFGDTKPIADNKTDEGKAQNRRTEFHIAEVGGKPFMGRDETAGGTLAPGQTPPPAPAAAKK